MESKILVALWLLLVLCFCSTVFTGHTHASDARQAYIVYMGDLPKGEFSTSSQHTCMLQEVLGSNAPSFLLHSYKKSFNGFVAMLTDEEKYKIAGMDGVVSVFPNEKKELHTTRSWDFMGFSLKVNRTTVESDIIIGVLDTGIWPESDSFKDEGFGPTPSKWKGTCQTSSNFTCNNKIIGARFYRSNGIYEENDPRSPRDTNGHGTHTASTAAGGLVSMANLYGLGKGTARGGLPGARIAVYKICWYDGLCHDADILAAFDDAIADGVDIISISVGGSLNNYFNDSIAIGSFHAMRSGILTSASGGNDGPYRATISNVAPWFLSVAASTIDRKFVTKVQLGDNKVYEGTSINTFEPQNMYPMIYGGDSPNATGNYNSSQSRCCSTNTLDPNMVRGKVVLCDMWTNGRVPLVAGAVGVVMQDRAFKDYAYSFPLPATHVGSTDGTTISNYINSTSNPTATIFKTYEGNETLAPFVASFSSRGPNQITPDVLKPDLTAPGVDILAAWSLVAPMTRVNQDRRMVPFNIISGTSMACPHATAVAAYIKSFHPLWSPSAIKSAMITTAFPLPIETSPEGEFAYGAGHMNPLKSVNPGLVYDAEATDYVKFLCGQGYSVTSLRIVTGDNTACSDVGNGTVWDLNLPSFALSGISLKPFSQTFRRTVTNVGTQSSTYNARVTGSPVLKIEVEPRVLKFTALGQKLSFAVKVEGAIGATMVSAALVWDDGTHQVRSPIVVHASS